MEYMIYYYEIVFQMISVKYIKKKYFKIKDRI